MSRSTADISGHQSVNNTAHGMAMLLTTKLTIYIFQPALLMLPLSFNQL